MKAGFLTLSFIFLGLAFSLPAQDTTWFNKDRQITTTDSAYGYWVDSSTKKVTLRKEFDARTHQLNSSGRYSSLDKGEKEGRFTKYYSNGKIKRISRYHKNKLEGPYTEYYKNGRLKIHAYYEKDLLKGSYKRYYPNGNLAFTSIYKDSLKNGISEYYYQDGTLRSTGRYEQGRKEGWWGFYKNTQLVSKKNYRTRYYIYSCNLHLRMPENDWLAVQTSDSGNFTFIKHNKKSKNISKITVRTENAEDFTNSPYAYGLLKQKPFIQKNTQFEKVLKHTQITYPLNLKNGIYFKGTYTDNDIKYHLHMITYVSPEGLGVHICFTYPENDHQEMSKAAKRFLKELKLIKNLDKEEAEKDYLAPPTGLYDCWDGGEIARTHPIREEEL
ncbi:toxin-antitoxin system YwqK family antitoxin [Cytophagaceae bacterium ABcell3]|nr:toxin-antitoxin system YwqK family antitoxin [Cytophagaceae bacterium ABcell3]